MSYILYNRNCFVNYVEKSAIFKKQSALFLILFRTKLSAEKFQTLMHLKALRSLAEPGESVGLLAAQVKKYHRSIVILSGLKERDEYALK